MFWHDASRPSLPPPPPPLPLPRSLSPRTFPLTLLHIVEAVKWQRAAAVTTHPQPLQWQTHRQKKNPLSMARQERKRTFCFRSYNKTMATIGDVDISPLSVQFTSFSWSLCEQAASSVESRSSWKQCHTGYVSSSSLTHWFDFPV